MSKKKKQEKWKDQDEINDIFSWNLAQIRQDIDVLFEKVGRLISQPEGCGNCDCIKDDEPYVSPTGIGQTFSNTGTVTWVSPEIKVAALEEANASLWEQLEDVEQEADEYARQTGDLRASLEAKQAKIELLRSALYDIAIHKEDNPSEAAWQAIEAAR
jgi:hypothetical protein